MTPCKQVYVADCEADDIIARIVKYLYPGKRKVIVSSDRDLYQLLSSETIQWSPGQKAFVTPKTVLEKFGVSVENFCTVRAFIGDSSDKIAGVRGAGFTSMSKRFPELSLKHHISTSDIIQLAESRLAEKKLKLYENILANTAAIKRNWKLMYLDTRNLSAKQIQEIDEKIHKNKPSPNKIELLKIFRREDIKNFNVDSFFITLKAMNRN